MLVRQLDRCAAKAEGLYKKAEGLYENDENENQKVRTVVAFLTTISHCACVPARSTTLEGPKTIVLSVLVVNPQPVGQVHGLLGGQAIPILRRCLQRGTGTEVCGRSPNMFT